MTTQGGTISRGGEQLSRTADDFDALYRREWNPMVRLAFLLIGSEAVAQEVVQDAFIEVRRRWYGLERPGGYLRTCVVNGSRSAARRESRHGTATVLAPDPVVAAAEPDDVLWNRVCDLPAGQREVVVLRFYEDLTVPQIAEVLGCRAGTVKSRLSRAIERLKEDR